MQSRRRATHTHTHAPNTEREIDRESKVTKDSFVYFFGILIVSNWMDGAEIRSKGKLQGADNSSPAVLVLY